MNRRGPYKSRKAPTKPKTLGERLKALRLERGLTQAKLAEVLLTDQTTVSSWERGKADPSGPALAALCRIFEIDRAVLETGKGLDKAYQTVAHGGLVSERAPFAFNPSDLKGKAGGIVEIDSGQMQVASPAELRAALEAAVKARQPVWIVRDRSIPLDRKE